MLAGACNLFDPSSTIRYRITVEVDTPQGLRTGSSVIEATTRKGPRSGDASGIAYEVHGEAVAVDLPAGTLFALLSNRTSGIDYPAYLVHSALENGSPTPPLSRRYEAWEWAAEQSEARRVKPTMVLTRGNYPTLVRFRDIHDPASLETVDSDDLAASFGPGVKLKRLTVEVTANRVTKTEERLPSLGRDSGYPQWRERLPRDDIRRDVTRNDFVETGA